MSRPVGPAGDDSTLRPVAAGSDDATAPQTSSERAAPTARTELPGYQLGEVIGRGGMGEVLAATDESLGREVALKRMRGAPTDEAVKRFVREATVQARLDHPAIVPVHALGKDAAGNPYFTMKRLTGTTLYAALAEGRPVNALLRPFADICFAIQLAHDSGIVHRDLKPSNVMLGNYNEVYVIDWGVARVLSTRRTSQVAIPSIDSLTPERDATAAGMLLGTPGYMAPEQMKGDAVTTAADVYSLGAILFEILAGQALHPPGKGAIASTLATATDSPARRAPDRAVPPELDQLCTRALAEEPRERPSARELAEQVQRYLDGDRDLEQRKNLATEQLAKAREALADPTRRAEAGQAASRALALDPESSEAAKLVTQLILEPPAELPPELIESLEASERELNRQRSRTAMKAFLALWLFLPIFVFWQHVKNVPNLAAVYAAATLMALISWHNGKTGRTSVWVMMAGNTLLAFTFSRLTSSFVLLVGLVCGQAMSLSTRRDIAAHRWRLIVWVIVTLMLPVVLEYLNVLPRTWEMTPRGFLIRSTIVETVHDTDIIALAIGQAALAIAISVFAITTTRAREEAQRRSHIQAWHLQRMLLRAPTHKD